MLRRSASSLGLEYRALDSPLHRLAPGVKIAASLCCSALAVALHGPVALAVLATLVLAGYALARLTLADLWRDTRWLLVQGLVLTALYALRDGVAQGVAPGARTSLQIVLFFLPAALLLRTTELRGLVHALRRVLPGEWAFVAGASLRFVPFFAREIGEIVAAQRLRGLPLSGRAWLRPRSLALAARCVLTPLLVRAVRVASEAGLAAEARGLRLGGEPAGCGIVVVRPEPAPPGAAEERPCAS